MVTEKVIFTSFDFPINTEIQELLCNYLPFVFPLPLSFLISQPFSSKRSWIVLRCVVPHTLQYIGRNSQLYTDCITPLDESYFLPLDDANRV